MAAPVYPGIPIGFQNHVNRLNQNLMVRLEKAEKRIAALEAAKEEKPARRTRKAKDAD